MVVWECMLFACLKHQCLYIFGSWKSSCVYLWLGVICWAWFQYSLPCKIKIKHFTSMISKNNDYFMKNGIIFVNILSKFGNVTACGGTVPSAILWQPYPRTLCINNFCGGGASGECFPHRDGSKGFPLIIKNLLNHNKGLRIRQLMAGGLILI